MRLLIISSVALSALAAVSCVPAATAAAEQRPVEDGRLMPPESVAENVWVMRQPDRLWAAVIGNVTIVEQQDGVVLIDSGGTIDDGRDIISAVARLTDKPVKAVILTHWHNDHPLGVPAIVERFPEARIISTKRTAEMMADPDVLNIGVGKPDLKRYRARAEASSKAAATFDEMAKDPALSAHVQSQYAAEAKWILTRLKRQEGGYVALPTETFTDSLDIDDPNAPVEAVYLGPANTKGDAFVWLPKQKVMITGDALVHPTPYGFTLKNEPWLETLDRMGRYDFRTLIPGHGQVQHDREYLDTVRWSLTDIRRQARELAGTAKDADEAWAQFDKSGHRQRFATNDAWTQRWLDDYWLSGMFKTAFNEEKGIEITGREY
jgi:glyoxylase-like metal-dependent hydrolase (beta-lactamase superfamily II)